MLDSSADMIRSMALFRSTLMAIALAAAPPAAGWALAQDDDAAAPAQTDTGAAQQRESTDSVSPTRDSAARIEAEAELEDIQRAIDISEERAAELRREIEEMSGDRAQQNAALIAAAQRVRLAEIEIGDTEDRLETLLAEEAQIRSRLDSADLDVANLLSALQRISRNPPPALVIDPGDALGSARSAILLSSVLPQYRDRADTVMADLRDLEAVKQQVEAERETLAARLAALQEEQLRIATLIEARRQGVERANQELAAQEEQAEQLAAEAESLNGLIASLRQRITAIDEAAAAAEAAESGAEVPELDDETIELALANTERTSPAVPFQQAEGYLAMPAAGVLVNEYGEDDGFGGVSNGLSIVTRADAQVVAPADGWVMYKGDYLNYGQIIILNPGDGHTILLAGLDEVNVELGQFVLLGEPVGAMGSRIVGRTVTTRAGVSRPTLYVEIRDSDGPLDPAGWWAEDDNDTRRAEQSGDETTQSG